MHSFASEGSNKRRLVHNRYIEESFNSLGRHNAQSRLSRSNSVPLSNLGIDIEQIEDSDCMIQTEKHKNADDPRIEDVREGDRQLSSDNDAILVVNADPHNQLYDVWQNKPSVGGSKAEVAALDCSFLDHRGSSERQSRGHRHASKRDFLRECLPAQMSNVQVLLTPSSRSSDTGSDQGSDSKRDRQSGRQEALWMGN